MYFRIASFVTNYLLKAVSLERHRADAPNGASGAVPFYNLFSEHFGKCFRHLGEIRPALHKQPIN